ncbi:hypothetical protein [Clostridium senegalense]|uniref:hypothetical protein n=1 Tax=Clostridium senegalense TaxID=1465809 RepID=UPI001C117974|nr:hypothetical protein [Clostridium senegalense]MBU5228353.1 hypothetical protein [Clostridium senegalense]
MKDKKSLIIILATLIVVIIGGIYYMKTNKSNKVSGFVQEEYSIKNTTKKNFLIKIKEGYSEEIINMNLMDNFIKAVDSKKNDEIYIIEYERNENGEIVTSLKKLNYDGSEIKVLEYDVSNQKEFKEGELIAYKKITKTGDNFGARIVGTTSEVQPIMEGDILFEYVESNKVEYE